ncbi:Uncharacterized protein Fot_40460 [Forsythia ovata]|uniref:Uncharacterized protein n=1 Tax=Forsythia ovata TaxID=205694 RepID=A0ABD1SA31_9LAMI
METLPLPVILGADGESFTAFPAKDGEERAIVEAAMDCNSFRHSSSVSTCNEEVLTRLVYVTGGVATASLSSLTTEDHERSRNGSPSSERLPSESVVGLGSSIIDVEIGRRFGFTCWRTRGQEDFLILSN